MILKWNADYSWSPLFREIKQYIFSKIKGLIDC